MERDRDYVVKDGEVVIVDEFTGRLMYGRRYSDGLHQAIEAKEGLEVQRESQTLATITFQNYFRMYAKLAGMTGTAKRKNRNLSRFTDFLYFRFQPINRYCVRISPMLSSRQKQGSTERLSRKFSADIRPGSQCLLVQRRSNSPKNSHIF